MNGDSTPRSADWCTFCQEFGEEARVRNEQILEFLTTFAPGGRVICEDSQLVVAPSLGPVTVGHVLIVPRAHYLSVAELPPLIMDDFLGVYERVRAHLEERFGCCTSFEHGCMADGLRAGACIDHAHMHLLPFGGELAPELSGFGPSHTLGDLRELWLWYDRQQPYLFCENHSHTKLVWSVGYVPSQLLRILIANQLGSPGKWDWRTDFGPETFRSTLKVFQEFKIDRSPVHA